MACGYDCVGQTLPDTDVGDCLPVSQHVCRKHVVTVVPVLDGGEVVLVGPDQMVPRLLQRRGLRAPWQPPDDVLMSLAVRSENRVLVLWQKESGLAGAEAGCTLEPAVAAEAYALAHEDHCVAALTIVRFKLQPFPNHHDQWPAGSPRQSPCLSWELRCSWLAREVLPVSWGSPQDGGLFARWLQRGLWCHNLRRR